MDRQTVSGQRQATDDSDPNGGRKAPHRGRKATRIAGGLITALVCVLGLGFAGASGCGDTIDSKGQSESAGQREAFVQTLRAVIDRHGQRVSATDRLYLLRDLPTLIAWGERDRTIPPEHGLAAQHAIPGSRFVTIPGAAHFPHIERPDELAGALLDFIASTEPASFDEETWQAILRGRSAARPRSAA